MKCKKKAPPYVTAHTPARKLPPTITVDVSFFDRMALHPLTVPFAKVKGWPEEQHPDHDCGHLGPPGTVCAYGSTLLFRPLDSEEQIYEVGRYDPETKGWQAAWPD